MNDDLNGRQSRGDQGASSAATKSCHGDKNRLTTPLTTYGNLKGEPALDFEQWCQENTNIIKLSKSLNSSSPEQYVGFYLSKIFDDIEYQKQFDWFENYSLDIYIPSLNLAIEYDGDYYHKKKTSNDDEKNSLCQSHSVEIFRIIEQTDDALDSETPKGQEVVIYFPDKRYRNINIAIQELLLLINKKFKLSVSVDINLDRDKKEILSYIQKKYHQKSIANVWPEVEDYWDSEKNAETIFDVSCTDDHTVYKLKCPHCGASFNLPLRYHYQRKSLIPHECEKQKIKENLHLAIKNYREYGHLIVFDNSLQSRRLYDEITSRIKCSYILSNASKEELEMYKKLGFESSVLDNCLAQYVDE